MMKDAGVPILYVKTFHSMFSCSLLLQHSDLFLTRYTAYGGDELGPSLAEAEPIFSSY